MVKGVCSYQKQIYIFLIFIALFTLVSSLPQDASNSIIFRYPTTTTISGNGTCGTCINGIDGIDGINGTDGDDGSNGANGIDGINGTFTDILNATQFENISATWSIKTSWLTNFINSFGFITWGQATNGTLAYLSTILGYGYYNSSSFDITDYQDIATLNASIDARLPISQTYNASTIATLKGVHYLGNISSVRTLDTNYYTDNESAVDPLLVQINFTGITTFDSVIMKEKYTGSLGHEILLEIYNYNTLSWESHFIITDQDGFVISNVPVLNPSELISGGLVQIRLRHTGGGIPSHVLYIDYFVLQEGTSTLTNADHDSLGGRDSVSNHPWAMPRSSADNLVTTGNVTASYLFGNYAESDPLWTGNFSLYNSSWSSTYNSTYNGYNSSGLIKDWNASTYIQNWNSSGYIKNWSGSYLTSESDPLWSANFTNYNSSWTSTYNSTYNGYNSSGLIKDWNASTYIQNWNATGYIKNWNASTYIQNWNVTGWLKNWTIDIWASNTSLLNWITGQNYISNATMNKSVSCSNILGGDADFCADATGGSGGGVNATSTTCSGTDKFSAYNNATGVYTCSADATGAGGGGINITTTTCGGTNKVSAINNATGVVTCTADQSGTSTRTIQYTDNNVPTINSTVTAYTTKLFTFPVTVNKSYTLDCYLQVSANVTTTGVMFNLSLPSIPAWQQTSYTHPTTATAMAFAQCDSAVKDCIDASITSLLYPARAPVEIHSFIQNITLTGDINLYFASEVPITKAHIHRGSSCELKEV